MPKDFLQGASLWEEVNSSANVFSFFRLDNNWLPIRPNTKWPMAPLFKGRHRNSNMEFLNNVQIFLNIVQRTFDSKVLFLCSLYPKKYFFSTFFCFFMISTIFNAQKCV